jgi:hypothetical protein
VGLLAVFPSSLSGLVEQPRRGSLKLGPEDSLCVLDFTSTEALDLMSVSLDHHATTVSETMYRCLFRNTVCIFQKGCDVQSAVVKRLNCSIMPE